MSPNPHTARQEVRAGSADGVSQRLVIAPGPALRLSGAWGDVRSSGAHAKVVRLFARVLDEKVAQLVSAWPFG